MSRLDFNWGDIPKAARLAFSSKKIWVYLCGLFSAYIIYQFSAYLGIFIWDHDLTTKVWKSYGLLPVNPILIISANPPIPAFLSVIVGISVAFIIFMLSNLTVSKVAYEQLRGDEFYPAKEGFRFAKAHLRSVIGSLGFLVGLFIFFAVFPLFAALVGQVGGKVGSFIIMIASSPLLLIPGFFLGLFMAFLAGSFLFGFFLIPAVVATTAEDLFETVYQLFSSIWNQPWRAIFYEALLFLSKAFWVLILAVLSLIGFQLIIFPASVIMERYKDVINRASSFTGSESIINKLANTLGDRWQFDILRIWGGNTTFEGSLPWTLDVAALFVAISAIFVLLFLISYFFSFGSVGNVIIYLIIRNKITGENLLDKNYQLSAISFQLSAKDKDKDKR